MKLTALERRFIKITNLPKETDLSVFPIMKHTPFTTNVENKKNHGEVFTPLQIVDHMIELSQPDPNKINLDLCAGRGQFTIRMLRYFEENYHYDIDDYLRNNHWFNEFNIDNAIDIVKIFGYNINLLIGDARELEKIEQDVLYGIYIYDEKEWKSLK